MAKTTISRLAAVGLGALILSGCGADSPEDLQTAVRGAAGTLAYPDANEAACIGDSVYSLVGYDQMVADGYTVASIDLDPKSSITTLIEANPSEELSASIVDCLDVNGRFRSDLGEQHLPSGVNCDTVFSTEQPAVKSHIDAVIAGEDPTITLEDTDENRDLVRPCATNEDFATAFELQTASELAEAIDEDLGTTIRLDEQPCAGPLVVEAVGFEKLNESLIGIDGASFDLRALELDDDTLESLVSNVADCSDFVERAKDGYRTAEPYFGDCIVAALDGNDEWLTPSAEFALGLRTTERAVDRVESFALDDCVQAQIETAFGENLSSTRVLAFDYAQGLFQGSASILQDYGPSEAEFQCMAYGLFHQLSFEEVLDASAVLIEGADETTAFWEANDLIWGTLGRARQTCFGDWMVVAGDVHRAGFSDETLACLRTELEEYGDITTYANLLASDSANLTNDEYWALIDQLDSWLLAFSRGLEDCYIDGEQAIFDSYMAWLNATGEEPELVTT